MKVRIVYRSLKSGALLQLALVLSLCLGSSAWGQVAQSAISATGPTAFISFGGLETHVEAFNYKALGVEAGMFAQRSPLLGVQVKAATYPLFARYSQSPITAGYRAEMQPSAHDFALSGYVGGGMSRSQDAGPHYAPTPAAWSPCWQASQGLTIHLGGLRWNPYDVTFTRTYTSLRTLSGLSVSSGFAYTFTRHAE